MALTRPFEKEEFNDAHMAIDDDKASGPMVLIQLFSRGIGVHIWC